MPFRRTLLPALAFAVAGQATAAPKADRSGAEAAILAGERAWGASYVTGDVVAADRLLEDSFRGVDSHGRTYGKADVLKMIKDGPVNSSDTIGRTTVRVYGSSAVAQAEEHEVGPGPEFKPVERVFTDTWIKRNGRWRIVAAEDLDPGSPTLPAYAADQVAILALRGESNRAISAHDLGRFTPVFADDATFVWSDGSSAAGKSGLEARFAKDFADPAFVTYVRTPERVSVSDTGVRAVEHGTWTAIKRGRGGETRYGGDYGAHWAKTAQGWRIRGELYVKLRCTGPLCKP